MLYVVFDTKYRVYNLGTENLTGLGLRSWGANPDQAEKLPHARALILRNAMNARTKSTHQRFIIQEVK
jgi:hypothetical protein